MGSGSLYGLYTSVIILSIPAGVSQLQFHSALPSTGGHFQYRLGGHPCTVNSGRRMPHRVSEPQVTHNRAAVLDDRAGGVTQAIKWAMETLQFYLSNNPFTLITDQDPLQWLHNVNDSKQPLNSLLVSLTSTLFVSDPSPEGNS